MLEVTRKTQERTTKQRLIALLNKEAKEYLELGIFELQKAGGIPALLRQITVTGCSQHCATMRQPGTRD
jgi:hypothetical protein